MVAVAYTAYFQLLIYPFQLSLLTYQILLEQKKSTFAESTNNTSIWTWWRKYEGSITLSFYLCSHIRNCLFILLCEWIRNQYIYKFKNYYDFLNGSQKTHAASFPIFDPSHILILLLRFQHTFGRRRSLSSSSSWHRHLHHLSLSCRQNISGCSFTYERYHQISHQGPTKWRRCKLHNFKDKSKLKIWL